MSDCLADIGGVTSTKSKLVHHFDLSKLDLSSRATEVSRDSKHVFNFLVVKIICAVSDQFFGF